MTDEELGRRMVLAATEQSSPTYDPVHQPIDPARLAQAARRLVLAEAAGATDEELVEALARRHYARVNENWNNTPWEELPGDVKLALMADQAEDFAAITPTLAALRTQLKELQQYAEASDKAVEVLKAENERLREALEHIAEERDVGRHDGLPEAGPAHEDYVMWLVARAALAEDAKESKPAPSTQSAHCRNGTENE